MSTPDKAVAAEHWYRHRTTLIQNILRDSKHGAALRHLPSGYPRVNMAWMWGALLAACMAAWLHQLTAVTAAEEILAGHGVRGGKAMIATLRWRLIAVPGRLIRHGRQLILLAAARLPSACRGPRPPPGTAHPGLTDTARKALARNLEPANPARHPGITAARTPEMTSRTPAPALKINSARYSRIRVRDRDVVGPFDQSHVRDLVDLLVVGDPRYGAEVGPGKMWWRSMPFLAVIAGSSRVRTFPVDSRASASKMFRAAI